MSNKNHNLFLIQNREIEEKSPLPKYDMSVFNDISMIPKHMHFSHKVKGFVESNSQSSHTSNKRQTQNYIPFYSGPNVDE